ncbi:uncharacterized protein BCR38DRAFT_491112 [Pseudomassariella vexata]|uniref:Uncharacterized protein n=1 Tax=Pseudomassariella vexata TaxID=1141098 RepID=A0A1Y2D8H8_9PEZI|nr:uncharacterized protein BCR38DRAFT_491112 [Pseudomassariella vexata]ORY55484.1 hypothetical protein BCR38DRAFT_491112 [Pseudomassariella vexata]
MTTTPPSHSPVKGEASPEKISASQQNVDGDTSMNVLPSHKDENSVSDPMPARLKQSVKRNGRAHTEQPAPNPRRHQTPEPSQRQLQKSEESQRSPSTPGHLAAFDWDEFEARYMHALADADKQEHQLLEEFDQLVKYFNVWASTSSSHDNERAVKRLQTRTRYVNISESKLEQKKKHLGEVVKAFQSALALLSQS